MYYFTQDGGQFHVFNSPDGRPSTLEFVWCAPFRVKDSDTERARKARNKFLSFMHAFKVPIEQISV